ncbi:Msx2-interacting protein SMART/HDAC1-associated repressor protein SPEN -like protein [Collichthys lucidus]|uniref:Msx2-interacting protein n=1 Tax=Collichthys lucidus TaxID=240159 RepID=A0A4U5UBJ4_COLLU|nr:Msx2-interacting protein SMART/HDAC1-associated repressor protein SPEN -like protein [Collichthys lucidus]
MVRETRHLWVGNLPEHVREEKIVEHFKRYGRVESVKVLRKRGSEGGVAAFVDFVDIKSAQKAHNAVNKMGDRDLRTDYNEPGSVPSAVRGLEDSSPSSSRDVTGFSRGTVGPVFGPPVSLHTREGRYERRIDGSSESRERAYDHSPYGHHERSGTFDRQRHYNADYYRDRSMFAAAGPGSSAIGGSFEASDPHFDSRIRDPFTLTNSTRRDLYRDDRGRRVDRTYHHRRSRSSHSSQSRHPSPQRTTGQTPKTPHSPKRPPLSPGRGPRSRSRSRSSSSDSVSSTSSTGSGSDSNSSSSDGSRARSVQSSATHAPAQSSMVLDSDEPRRSFGIKVQNLPVRSTDTSLKDGLFHEFKKHGKVTSVQIHGASEDRYGLVFFRQQEDQEKALTVSKGKLFFGMLIEVTAWNGPETESENEFRPLDGRIDEFHPKATRTLFIGNLEKTTSYQQLLDIFQRFGEIVDIDIKKVNGVPQYAFVQYSDIASVCKAIKKMDGEYLGSNRLKLGFGKSMPTTCVWLDGLATSITEQYLTRHFCRYGHVVKVVFDRLKGMALILYNNTDFAQAAVRETKGWKIGGNKIKVDFASQESQMAFYRSMQASGQDIRDFYEIPPERREERRPPYHEFTAERAYYENIRTPGLYPEDARRDYAARSRERFPELEHYQGDHFDPRYHEDPRDYRDYRDPFEQDIRKYTYIQRERERERERFEADRSRWSPSHPRRPVTPTVSPSPSERAPRDSERRVYSQSSERSGSVSSMSPPHFDKSEKTLLEHASKSDKSEKTSQPDRVAGAEKTKRAKRKEKGDKDKAEKIKSRKAKGQSPSNPIPEPELETGFDGGSGRGRGSDQDAHERQKSKGDSDSLTGNQLSSAHHDSVKSERSEMSKSENSDLDGKNRLKKHLKSDPGNDGKDSSIDSDCHAAKKRRFADSGGRNIRPKRSRHEEEDGVQSADFGASASYLKESDTEKHKDSQRRDSRLKPDKSGTQKEGQEDLRGQREKSEGSLDPLESKRHPGHTSSRRFSHEGITDQSSIREQEHHAAFKFGAQNADTDKSAKNKEDHVDIDLSQSYRKQMEQNRRLHQQQQQRESDKPDKPGSPQESETEDLEHRSLVHEVGKPPEDVTDNFPSHKLKKLDQFDADSGIKKERVYRSFRQKSEDPDWNSSASPGHQHFSHHADVDFVDPPQKELSRNEEKIHPDLELLVKRTHNTQVNKPNTPLLSVEEEQQKRWESRVKQDLLPDLNFSRSLSKNIHNRKRLEYGIWHDLEPGEVRSDPEEERDPKPHSPVPSTSMPFSERPRVDRFSDPKLAHLERNKFCSYALDQTITPDTKALLERAKSLSSSREDNWSFLDYDSQFASLRNRKDTEKVESAPRPTPSWYIIKKKTRIGSEDKLDDRKEEPKPEEQERRELFASRFLHSPVFELDSRRLQHLERKHEEPEHAQNQQSGQQGTADGELDSGPVVLFQSRFLELTRQQQQKNKTQQLQEVKADAMLVDENKVEKSPAQEQQALQTTESVTEPEIKPISPAEDPISELQLTPTAVAQSVVKNLPPPEEKCVALNPAPDPYSAVSFIKEEVKEEAKENEPVVPVHHPPTEASSDSETATLAAAEQSYLVDGCKLSPSEGKLDIDMEDVKPPSSEKPRLRDSQEFVSSSEAELDPETTQQEVPDATSPMPPSLTEEVDIVKKETYSTSKAVAEPEEVKKLQIGKVSIDNDTSNEPTSPQKEHKAKEIKNKKCKQSPAQVAPVPVLSTSGSEKQATRKSERIDKEKLKRGSSPRAEARSTGKSPIHGSDPDMLEQSISLGRARRRNVKSVYATVVEDDVPVRYGKETTESPRSARKRGTDKDATQQNPEQDPPAPNPPNKRGRPPKNRKQGEETLAVKVEKSKMDNKDTDSNESESGERIPRASKGKTSPHSAKSSLSQMSTVPGSGSTRKAEKTEVAEDDDQEMDFTDEDSLALQDTSSSCKEDLLIKVDQKKEDKGKQGRELDRDKDVFHEKACEGKSNGQETDSSVSEEKPTSEKDKIGRGKTKLTRTPKSPVLKNLKIRLNVAEVKDLLQLGDDELGNQEDSSKKLGPGEHSDHVSKSTNANRGGSVNEEKENAALEKKDLLETPKNLISQELELEQAVENIAKLTDPAFPTEPPTPPVPPAEVKSDPEEEKPSNPASETELMAAIDSITADPAVSLTQAPPPSADVGSEPEMQDFIQPAKEEEPETNAPALQEEPVFPTTPKKGSNKGRPKRSKNQKQAKKDLKEGHSASEESATTLTDATTSSVKIVPESTPSAATAAVITPTTWKSEPEPSAVKATDINAESESSPEEHTQHLKSVNPRSKSPICPKPQQAPSECVSPSMSPLASRPSIRPIQPTHQSTIRIPVSPPDWRHQSKDTGVSSSPVMPLASKENQPLPSDSENMDVDLGTSDLRQILMKHKNMPLPGSSSIPSNLLTLRDQNPTESNTTSAVVPNKSPLPDGRMPTHQASSIVRSPASLPSPETKSVISVIASTATSVISRVCNPPEPEDKVNMNIANPCVDMALPKPTYRPNKDDSGTYHGPSVGDEVGSAARFIVESPTLGTGSCPGLRVNTSEGVVVLSHSGQKTEGRQRISAKISQIPQATAGDMESQQLVSMPQIKEMYGHSHSGLQKGPSSQTDHGHPGKMQSTLSSIKQESTGLEKMESAYQSGPQGVVKRLGQGNQQVMSYHQEYMPMKHQKKIENDSHSTDGAKPPWTSAISPAISPHLPSPPGNHVGFVTAAADRAPSHISGVKQEPRSPRKSGHPHSPFTKVSSPIGSSSPKGIPVMLSSGIPAMQQFIPGVHHPEQSVIMPPHSVPGGLGRMSPHRVTQSIPVGHLVQDVRVNTPPLSVMSYGMHSESHSSPWSGPMQPRPTSPQAVGRDKVLKVNPSLRGHEGEQEETRRFQQAPGRQSATQIKPDTMQSDPRGPLRGSVQLETYMAQRDMRVLLHQQGDPHSGHIQETPPSSAPSSLPMSLSPRAHVLPKGVSEKDITKPLEAKRPHSPIPKDGMMGIRQSVQAMASPQRVQLITPGPSGSFSEYSGMYSNPRGIHSQVPETSPVGLNQPPLSVTPTMGADLQAKPDGKMTQPVNMVQLLTKYPIVWQGLLALKNDTAAVQLHFVCGNKALAHRSLPLQEGGALLRIVQRMRLEASQLESVARRMTGDSDFCLLLALPCGRDQDDVLNQTQALKAAFINYLQTKLAAGIINIPNPGSNQVRHCWYLI